MKKTLKILALAGALTLCLLLTGCYQPPDEVNNGLPNNGGQTAALFDTMPPTATVVVTPDTVVVETRTSTGRTTATPRTHLRPRRRRAAGTAGTTGAPSPPIRRRLRLRRAR